MYSSSLEADMKRSYSGLDSSGVLLSWSDDNNPNRAIF